MAGLSLDLRMRVMDDVDLGMSAETAAARYSVSARAVYNWKRLKRETGSLAPRRGKTGPKRKLDPYRETILAAIQENPDLTLEALQSQLQLPGCLQTLWNALHRWGIVLKKSYAGSRTTAA
jgi:transposase